MRTVLTSQYNDVLSLMTEMVEDCSSSEKTYLESAIEELNRAKLENIRIKKDEANAMYSEGTMDSDEVIEYMSYLESEEVDAIQVTTPYMTEAGMGTSAALAISEAKAYNSDKYTEVTEIKNGTRMGKSAIYFIHSRLKKAAILKQLSVCPTKLKKKKVSDTSFEVYYQKSKVASGTITQKGNSYSIKVSANGEFTDSVYSAYISATCGIMTAEIKSELANAKSQWKSMSKKSEKVIKEYVESVIAETGSTESIDEHLQMALESGDMNFFAIQVFNRIRNSHEIKLLNQ